MVDLPTGIVTFVFTDIEGSTPMVQRLGDGFRAVLTDHHRLIREAFREGVEIRSEGDAFFYVFRDSRSAVSATVAAQRHLLGHSWPDGGTVRVRMGLHTAQGVLGGDDYIGVEVHRAARIAAAGHGAQILASDAVQALVRNTMPDIGFRDMGSHRFKGLEDPERVYQVLADDLPAEFPPIRSLDSRTDNFPSFGTEFVGRQAELDQLAGLVAKSRLVTITGPGGTGKTRVAVEGARRALSSFEHGATFIPLDSVADPSLVDQAILTSMGLVGVPGSPDLDTVIDELAGHSQLLVLDNFEHVLAAAATVGEILDRTRQVRVLVTSQASLGVSGEQVMPLPPLSTPNSISGESEAVRLFVNRIRMTDPSFEPTASELETIDTIVTRLNGLPLALELAAPRVRLLGLSGLLGRLDQQLDVLKGKGGPARHQTLRDSIAWSYSLLSTDEQRLLQAIALFDGSFTLDGVEAVAGGDVLESMASLLDKSLVQRFVVKGEARFRLLDSIRRFSREALEASGRAAEVAGRLAHHYGRMAGEARRALEGGTQDVWLARYVQEHDSLRSVAMRAVEQRRPDEGLLAVGPAWRFFHRRGHLDEGIRLLRDLLTIPGASDMARAEGLNGLAGLLYWQGKYDETQRLYLEALDLFIPTGDQLRIAETYFGLATTAAFLGAYDQSDRYADLARSAYEAAGHPEEMRRVTAAQAFGVWQRGELERAEVLWTKAAELYQEVGDVAETLQTEVARASIAHQLGRTGEAIGRLDSTLDRMLETEDVFGTVMVLDFVAAIGAELVPDAALRLSAVAYRLREEMGGSLTPEAVGLPSAREVVPVELAGNAWQEGAGLDLDGAVKLAHDLARHVAAATGKPVG